MRGERSAERNRSAEARRAEIADVLRELADWCGRLGSPLYAGILARAADDCRDGGPTWAVLDGHEENARLSALALRLAGAVHRLVLTGEAPALARHYPSAGGTPGDAAEVWRAFRAVLEAERERLRASVVAPVQTNEVGRSACLLGGFLAVARASGLPLRLLEVGSSAGLNLRFDRYRYESPGFAFGDPDSPVRFERIYEGRPPRAFAGRLDVAERAGCDARPLAADTEEGRLALRSFLWPDQAERRARLDAALEVAARVPAPVERADACEWLARRLAPAAGAATVVFHSIVLQYLGRAGAARLAELVREAGARAEPTSPLAWLRLEPVLVPGEGLVFRVLLTSFPGGEERTLAACSPHGPPVSWLAEDA